MMHTAETIAPLCAQEFDEAWITDPCVFAVNRMPAHAAFALTDANGLPMEHRLDGMWKFHYAETPAQAPKDFHMPNSDSYAWDDIQVPGYIQLQGSGRYGTPQYVNTQYPWDGHEALTPPQIPQHFNPTGSYLHRFCVPAHWDGAVCIRFDGVETAFAVWCNGIFIGYSEDSFTPSEFDLSAAICRTGENVLAVRVYRFSTASWLEDQDFWRMSGIFRSVWLFTKACVHLADVHLIPLLDAHMTHGTLTARLTVEGESGGTAVLCAFGETTTAKIDGGQTALCLDIDAPLLWSAEAPHLYEYTLELRNTAGQILERTQGRIGFRQFELCDGLMCLNGKRIVFKGVNRHEWNAHTGRTITYQDMLCDIRLMKQNNINAVRTSHYPNRGEWYDLCDAYGIYLIDETNLETHGTWQRLGAVTPDENTLPGDRAEWRDAVLDRANSMLQRDKNHTSILIWSCGNEACGGKTLWEMSELFRAADPSRLVHYEGIRHDRRYNDTSDMESQMYTPAAKIVQFLEEHPEKPFIMCEYMHAMGSSCGGTHRYTELTDTHPRYQGGFIWDWIDQGIWSKDPLGGDMLAYGGDFGDRPTDFEFVGNGLLYADRMPTSKLYEIKGCYADFTLIPSMQDVTIHNKSLFTSIDQYRLDVSLQKEGKTLAVAQLSASGMPGEIICVPLPHALCIPTEQPGEYTVTARLCLRDTVAWAAAGHEVAVGQFTRTNHREPAEETQDTPAVTLTVGDVNIGVHGENFSLLFTKNAQGNIISYRWKGRELLERPLAMNFWRAPTDNDAAARTQWAHLPFKTAGLYAKLSQVQAHCDGQQALLEANYTFAHGDAARIEYKITGDGVVRTMLVWQGTDYASVPEFGLQLTLPARYRSVAYYGLGQGESYADFTRGVQLGCFNYDAHTALAPYFNPQESGARMGVRTACITDESGVGLRVTGDAMLLSALPYTPHELENACHQYELPPKVKTVVRCAKGQLGIGGDDTWGAKPHAEYILPLHRGDAFNFSFGGTDTVKL